MAGFFSVRAITIQGLKRKTEFVFLHRKKYASDLTSINELLRCSTGARDG